jgi:hypothetical protein
VDTGLRYRRGSYGPYAEELKPIIGKLMNNGLVRERRLGRMIEVRTGETFEDARVAYRSELQDFESAIKRTADLFMRVNTNRAEIVASIRFVASAVRQKTNEPTERDVLAEVLAWKRRRRPPLDQSEVALHVRNLAGLGWIEVKPSPDLPFPEDEF